LTQKASGQKERRKSIQNIGENIAHFQFFATKIENSTKKVFFWMNWKYVSTVN
jgi:hypothetical protein